MRAHSIGHGPGLAAPEAAASLGAAGAASVVADAVAPAGLNAKKESAPAAQATQSREQNEHMNSATSTLATKAFLILPAKLALPNVSLSRTHSNDGPTCYYINRWGMVRELIALKAFVRHTGVVI